MTRLFGPDTIIVSGQKNDSWTRGRVDTQYSTHASLTSTILGGEDVARNNDLRKMRKDFNAKIEAFKNEYDTIAFLL